MPTGTVVAIDGDDFWINGSLTHAGRVFDGMRVEGLLTNSRMVQGIFDDLNPETRSMWDYPDSPWDPERNTAEFIAAMPQWREHGLLSFTINLQGGNPRAYSREQPWHNSAFRADGSLREDYMGRLRRILDRADELGMAPIVGYFYFGQDQRLEDEEAVLRATGNATDWLLECGCRNVLVEVANEVDLDRYDREIIRAARCHELIRMVQERSAGKVDTPAGRLLVSASMAGGRIPPGNLIESVDFLLLHGNGVERPDRIRGMVEQCRDHSAYRGQPILFNEDDHYGFVKGESNMLAAISSHAGWGFFDWRRPDEGYDAGYQSVPVNWGISSERKRAFFDALRRMTSG